MRDEFNARRVCIHVNRVFTKLKRSFKNNTNRFVELKSRRKENRIYVLCSEKAFIFWIFKFKTGKLMRNEKPAALQLRWTQSTAWHKCTAVYRSHLLTTLRHQHTCIHSAGALSHIRFNVDVHTLHIMRRDTQRAWTRVWSLRRMERGCHSYKMNY